MTTSNSERNQATLDRYLLDLKIKHAMAHVQALVEAVQKCNPIEQGIAGSQLGQDFDEIWKLRKLKDETWAMAVNAVQIVIAGIEFEVLVPAAAAELQRAIGRYFNSGSIDEEDLANMNADLIRVGLNPFSVFS